MIRLEIIAHEALEEPLMDEFTMGKEGRSFTLFRRAAGRGRSGSAFGDEVWPESNVMMILFLEEHEEALVRARIQNIRRRFPRLGLAAFALPGCCEWYDTLEGT